MKKFQGILGLGVTALSLSLAAGQAPFTAGNLVVLQIGDGTTTIAATATPLYLVEMTTGGVIVQTVPLPVVPSGANKACTTRGTSTAAGHLTRSPDGKYIFTVGFDAAVGAADPTAAASATVARVVARVTSNATIDTTTALSDAYNTSDIRAAISVNDTDLWISGNTGSVGTGGARYTTLGATTSIQLCSVAPTNLRMIGIHNGQLYVTSATSTFQGVSVVGTGLPTTTGQFISSLPGFPTATGPSNYDFWYADDDTLYIADDATLANGGGLQKWTQSAGNWTKAYTFQTGVATGSGCRALAGKTKGGTNTLYVTSSINGTTSVANSLFSIVDTGPTATFTTVATAPAAGTYRGLAWAPVGGGPAPCYPNCDGSTSTPRLTANDFQCFLNAYASNLTYANCDNSTSIPLLTANDFQCFLNSYASGCT